MRGTARWLVAAAVAAGTIAITWDPVLAEEPAERPPQIARLTEAMNRLPLDEHVAVVSRLQSRLRDTLLTPRASVVEKYAEIERDPKGGIARLLPLRMFWNRLGFRGDGSDYDFAARTNVCLYRRDIAISNTWTLRGFGAGGDFSIFSKLDKRDIRDVTADDVPQVYRGPATALEGRHELARRMPTENLDTVVAMRSIAYGESDRLYAIQIVDRDEFGVTLAWRELESYGKTVHPSRRSR